MKQTILLIALGAVFALPPAFAAEPTLASVVTAAKRPQAVDTALASVTVFTREDIERIQAQDSVTLLRHFAGVVALEVKLAFFYVAPTQITYSCL